MLRLHTIVITVTTILVSNASIEAQTMTLTPKSVIVAGVKYVYSEGSYTLMPGQTIDKIKTTWYKQQGMNLIYAGDVTDSNPAGGKYVTNRTTVPLTDGAGMPILYTVIGQLWVTGNANPVAG